MKTNLKRISKRSLALILGILMLFSTLMVGTISTANAAGAVSGVFAKGEKIYYDFSATAATEVNYYGENATYDHTNSLPDNKIIEVTLLKELNLNTLASNNINLCKTNVDSWGYDLKATVPPDGANMVIVASDSKSFTWGTYGGTTGGGTTEKNYYYSSNYDERNHFKLMTVDPKHPDSYIIYVSDDGANKSDTATAGFLNDARKFKIADSTDSGSLDSDAHCVNHKIYTNNYSQHINTSPSLTDSIDFHMDSEWKDLYIRNKGTSTATSLKNFYIQYKPSDGDTGLNGTITIWSTADYESLPTSPSPTVTPTESPSTTVRLYYDNPNDWPYVYAYLWKDSDKTENAQYPGEDIKGNYVTINNTNYYYVEFDSASGYDRIIFNNKSTDSDKKTKDIVITASANGKYWNGITWADLPQDASYGEVTARLELKNTQSKYEKNTTYTRLLHAYSKAGDKSKQATTYKYEYYYSKSSDLSNPVPIATHTQTGVTDADYANYKDANESTWICKDDCDFTVPDAYGKYYFYVIITGYSDADCTNRTTVMANSSAKDKPYINVVDPNYKKNAYSGSNLVWVDARPDYENGDTASLIKWSFAKGDGGTATDGGKTLYTFYLPSSVDMNNLHIYHNLGSLNIGDTPITSGNTYPFTKGTVYDVTGDVNAKVVFRQGSTESGQLYLNTVKGSSTTTSDSLPVKTTNIDYKVFKKDNQWTGSVLYAQNTGFVSSNTIKKLKGRGNSSFEASCELFGKYAYNLTLTNAVQLFGMANKNGNTKGDTKYCLLANDFDSTQARNSYIYKLAKELGFTYFPDFKMTDVYDNGEYMGSYLITQKVELGSKALINVSEVANTGTAKETPTKTTYNSKPIAYDAGVTEPADYQNGTYLMEFELCERYQDEISWFVSGQGQPICVASPESASLNEVKFLKDKWDYVEDKVYTGKLDEIRDKIDVESFAKMYLIQELTKNLDACATSYNVIYKGSEDKFYAEPVWDFDWALGNHTTTKALYESPDDANKTVSDPTGFFARYKSIYADGDKKTVETGTVRDFQSALCRENSSFWADVQNIWKNEFYEEATNINTWLSGTYADQIKDTVAMNEYRWGFIDDIGNNRKDYWGTTNTGTNFVDCTNSLTGWITNRLKWLNKETDTSKGIPDRYYTVTATAKPDTATASVSATAIPSASSLNNSIAKDTICLFSTKNTDENATFKGWFDNADGIGTALSTEPTYKTTITGDTTLYAVYSAAVDSPYVYTAPNVTLNADKTDADSGDTITLTATATDIKVTHNGGTPTDYTGNIVYKFYRKVDGGDDILINTVTSTNTTATATIRFDDTATYYVVAYPSFDENANNKASVTVKNLTVTNKEIIKLYVDFNEVTLTSEGPTVTVTGDKGQNFTYTLTQLGNSNIFYNDQVEVVYYTKSDGSVENGFKLVNITDGDTKVTVNKNQPDLNKVLENKILWYIANTRELQTNYSEEYYQIVDTLSHTNDGDYQSTMTVSKEFNPTQKRVYLTDNSGEKGLTWSKIYASYSTDGNTWTEYTEMRYSGLNQYKQKYYFVDLPYDVTGLKFAGDTAGTGAINANLTANLDYKTDNAYYFETSKQVLLWPGNNGVKDFPVTPIILNYNADVYVAVGETVDITPSEHSASKKITYEGINTSIATVTASGDFGATVTGVAKGVTTVTLTPYGTIGDNDIGETATVTVHVVDKNELNMLVGNGENAISLKNSGAKDYVEASYNGFLTEYAYALDVYNTSFNQTEIDDASARLRKALEALHTAQFTSEQDQFSVLAYNSAISQVVSADTARGTVSIPDVKTNNYTKAITNGYEVLYAAVGYKLTSTATQVSTPFSNWTVSGVEYSTNETLDVASAPGGTTVYTANFAAPEVQLTIKYNFNDFDSASAGTFEYVEGHKKPASYTTSKLYVSNAVLNDPTELAKFVKVNAPKLKSNYFKYTFDDNSISTTPNDDGTYSVNANFTESMQTYSVYVGTTLIGDNYHYQELITIPSSDFIDSDNIYWYYVAEDGTRNPVSTDVNYEFRVTKDLYLGVAVNEDNLKVDETSVVTHAYTEFLVNSSNQKQIHQNFYIQDFFDAEKLAESGYKNAKFVGAGVFFYTWNDSLNKPSKSAVTASLNNLDTYALQFKNMVTDEKGRAQGTDYLDGENKTGLAYSYIDAGKDNGSIIRYASVNSCYNYFFDAIMNSNSAYAKYSYRVHSFYIYSYDNGKGTEYKAVVSDTYASAKVYQVGE